MSSGIHIIQQALARLNAHSVLSPASPESIQAGYEVLNGMIADYEDDGIKMGTVPLSAPGAELSEPLGSKNAIIDNLAIQLAPLFPAIQISRQLRANAQVGYNKIVRRWKTIVIPKPVVRETLPLGQGNTSSNNFLQTTPFFAKGSEIG